MSRVRTRTNIPDSTFSASSNISNVIAGDGRVTQVGERARKDKRNCRWRRREGWEMVYVTAAGECRS